MAFPVVPRLTSGTPDLNRSTSLIKGALDPLLKQRFLTGRLVEDIEVTGATPFVVSHGLGRAWTGYVVVASSGSAMMQVREDTTFTPTPDPNKQLALMPSATGTLSLWIF